MIKRLVSWLADHFVEVVGIAVGIGGIGVFANGLSDLGSLWRDHTWAMCAWSFLCLVLGVAIGDSRGMSRYLQRRHDEQAAAERADEEATARKTARDAGRRRKARERILGLSYDDKRFILTASKRSYIDTKLTYEPVVHELFDGLSDLVSYTEVGSCVWRIRLTEYGRYAVDVASDILAELEPEPPA